MTRSTRLAAAAALAALATAMVPLSALPAAASTEVVAAPLPAPTGLSPADDQDTFPQTVRKDIVFSWNAVDGATGYRVQFGRDDTWSDVPLASFDTKNTALTVPPGSGYATYTWRVAALKGTVVGHWTSESTNAQNEAQFTKGWRQFPGSPSTSFSGAGAPTFMWRAIPGASKYKVVVSKGPIQLGDFETAPEGGSLCATTRNRLTPVMGGGIYAEGAGLVHENCVMVLEANTTYYWRVQGIDEPIEGGPETTLASEEITFTTGPDPAGNSFPDDEPVIASASSDPDRLCTVTNASPERSLCNDIPTIRWSAVPGATHYKVYLSPDSLFQSVVDVVKTDATEWTTQQPWSEMSPSMSMYYDVEACGDVNPDPLITTEGCTDSISGSEPSFRKVSPRMAGLSTPPAIGRLAFSWTSLARELAAVQRPTAGAVDTASQDAKGYHVQVATSDHPSFDATVIDAIVDGPVTEAGRFTTTGGTTYIPSSELLLNGSYLWRVQAVDSAGNKLPWSLSKAFTRDNTPPKLLSVTPSSNVSTTGALKLVFSEPVTGLSSSSVWLSPAAPTTLTVTGPTTATLTPTKPLLPGATYGLRVGAPVQDAVGNAAVFGGPNITVNPLADDANPAISYSSGWGILSSTNAVGGRFHTATPSSTVRQSASMVFRGTGVVLTACLGPANGYVDTYVDGVRRGRTNLYRSFSGCGVKVFGLSGLARGQHTVKIVATNLRSASSSGAKVTLDAFTVTP